MRNRPLTLLFSGVLMFTQACPEKGGVGPPPDDMDAGTDSGATPDMPASKDRVVPDAGVMDAPLPEDMGVTPAPDVAMDDAAEPDVPRDVDLCANDACPFCTPTQRLCGRMCVEAADPAYGCGNPSCVPCRYANAAPTCMAGQCAMGMCVAGFANCDDDVDTGCETNVTNNPDNCGACGRACELQGVDRAGCAMGACTVVACAMGAGNCDGTAANGCEVDLNASPMHCGTCGNRCVTPNATPGCDEGRCTVDMCNVGFANCNMMAADGCETNTRTDVRNCGDCGQACAFANATPTCANGMCVMGACAANFGNCDNDPGDGCETDLRSSPQACGRCGATPCPEVCLNGACALCNTSSAGRACSNGGMCRCVGGTCACTEPA